MIKKFLIKVADLQPNEWHGCFFSVYCVNKNGNLEILLKYLLQSRC